MLRTWRVRGRAISQDGGTAQQLPRLPPTMPQNGTDRQLLVASQEEAETGIRVHVTSARGGKDPDLQEGIHRRYEVPKPKTQQGFLKTHVF